MRRVRLTLEYDGTGFHGWQRQATGERTVQGVIEEALDRLPGKRGPLCAAGRTDAGVHALAMVAHVDKETDLPDERLRLALNAHLPREIAVLDVVTAPDGFEAQFDCTYRRYLYRLKVYRDQPAGLALERDRVLPVFRRLDVEAMDMAAETFVGARDLSVFATQETRSRTRTVYLCALERCREELRLHVAADGFLRNMVRAMVGTLLWVGKGRLSPDDMHGILESRDRTCAGNNVPPQGLYFVEAGYQDWDRVRSDTVAGERISSVLG